MCDSGNGEFPTFCEGIDYSSSGVNCKAKCSSQTTCVAYNFILWDKCYLLVSEYECPSGFTLNMRSVTVTSTNDLVVRRGGGRAEPGWYVGWYQGATCYGKNSG